MSIPSGVHSCVQPGANTASIRAAAQLAASQRSLQELRWAQRQGLPIYAECGGLLLLGQELTDHQGNTHAMAGLLPFRAERGQLSLGYRSATAAFAVDVDTLLAPG